MKRSVLQRIVGLNLAILVVLAALLRLADQNGGYLYAAVMAALISFMSLVNAGFGLTSAPKAERQAHWLSVLLVLLIGFGLCGAGLMMRR